MPPAATGTAAVLGAVYFTCHHTGTNNSRRHMRHQHAQQQQQQQT